MQTLSNFPPKGCPPPRNLIRRRPSPQTSATPLSHTECRYRTPLPISAHSEAVEGNPEKPTRLDVRALARTLWESRSADDVASILGGAEDIHPRVFSSMIKGLGMDKKLDACFALVEFLKEERFSQNGKFFPNLIIYNALLGAIKNSGDYSRVDEVMEDMIKQGMIPNIITYNTLMHIYINKGEFDEARKVMENMRNMGIMPSAATYSTVLLSYEKSGDAAGAIVFFVEARGAFERGEMKEENLEVEFAKFQKFTVRICYKAIREWLVKGGDEEVSGILRLMSDMDVAGLAWEREDLERLSWACTREAHYVIAREIYTRIRSRDSGISLSVCNHIIWLMGKAKKWWAALEIYEDLLESGPKPNNLSNELIISHFNVLLSGARRRGIWRFGVRMLDKMMEKGLKPGVREWNSVLVACSKASETCAGVEIFKRMIECGEKPTIVSYGALLSALEKGEFYDEALRVWDHMVKAGIEPNLYAYTMLNCIHIGSGRPELVDLTMRDMGSKGIEPTVVTYNAIISVFARKNKGSVALEWYHRMKVRGIAPDDVTYEMLVKALTGEGKARVAYEVYLRAKREGFMMSAKAYDAVVQACLHCGVSYDLGLLGPRPPRTKTSGNSGKSSECHSFDGEELISLNKISFVH